MSAAHTPGPWYFRQGTTYSWPTVVLGGGNDKAAWGVPISRARGIDGATSMEELNANARLIAAAPDLLASLKELLIGDVCVACNLGEPCGCRYARARAVVEKAEGKP